jgi:hypothetical protein
VRALGTDTSHRRCAGLVHSGRTDPSGREVSVPGGEIG